MACGATLKRSVGLEPLHGPPSPKRRKCSPLCGPGATQPGQRCSLSAAAELHSSAEQIFQNFRQEYSRYQRRRQAEGGLVQSDGQGSGDEWSSSPTLSSGPSSGPSSPTGVWVKKDQPFFTLRQVSYLCERLLKEHEEALREEYDRVLNGKLAEQYEAFVKFTEDQIVRRYGERPASYVS